MSDKARQNFLNKVRIQKDLEKIVGNILARHGNPDDLITGIAALNSSDQDFVYHWAEVISASDKELAAHFIARAPQAFSRIDRPGVEAWVIKAMDAFDKRGLGVGVEVLDQLDRFVASYVNRHVSCSFGQVSSFLQHFVNGLGGRELQVVIGRTSYTDTEKLFLPEVIGMFADQGENARLYKLLAAHLWAQTWYGTWRYQVVERLSGRPDLETILPVFNRLECIRLEASLGRDFAGLRRQMRAMGHMQQDRADRWSKWTEQAHGLTEAGASALDSCALVDSFKDMPLPELTAYQSEMYLGRVHETLSTRADREKTNLKQALDDLQQELAQGEAGADPNDAVFDQEQAGEFSVAEGDAETVAAEFSIALQYSGKMVPMSKEMQDLLGSIMQDFGEIPEDHLQATPRDQYPDELEPTGAEHLLGPDADQHMRNAINYREWDYTRQRFREDFCVLNEFDVPPGDERFVDDTLDKYRGILKSIKKTFEAVLGESRLQRRQSQGDDIDIDALVEARADAASGREMSEYVYTRYQNMDRNIAVMFMVDMSGSTLGWINNAERESLILLCEALETLGDRYAIYGFSGRTNKRCEVHRVKTFAEPYNLDVRQRISGIKAKSYTRMGVAIRHLGHLLNQTQARTKLLIALSDGRPEDYGGYKGRYGIEDTRHALLELKRDGIHSFCITIDKEAQRYLPHMYGVANYAVIDQVQKLPYKVADIYRRLTT